MLHRWINWPTSVVGVVSIILSLAAPVALATSSDSTERKFIVSLSAEDGKVIADAQLKASESGASGLPEGQFGVAVQEEFRSDKTWFMAVNAADQKAVEEYMAARDVDLMSVYESLFVNSPELGGGPEAGAEPMDGHNIYMIQRSIPGIGLAPMEQKVAVSKGSQKIIESLDGAVEWDHSFLTSEGTFCVYRAGDPAMIEEHARIAGIPADPITEVEHLIRNYEFK